MHNFYDQEMRKPQSRVQISSCSGGGQGDEAYRPNRPRETGAPKLGASLVRAWKKQLQEDGPELFRKEHRRAEKEQQQKEEALYE